MSGLHDVEVGAVGPKDADIYLLGESPGKDEARKCRPFVGRAGGQLNDLLGYAGIPRSECRVGNACRYWPKGKKADWFFREHRIGKSGGNPKNYVPTDRFLDGMDKLLQDLKVVRPNVIVAFGNYALWAMTQDWGITKWWGSILEASLMPGQKVIPVIHPAAVLRNKKWKPMATWHLQRAKQESQSPEIVRPERNYIVSPSQQEIDNAVERLLGADHFTFDTEWYTPRDLACIGFTDNPDWAICIPAYHPGALHAYDTLLGSSVPKIAQNAFFDITYLRTAGIEVNTSAPVVDPEEDMEEVERIVGLSRSSRLIEDTMVGHHVCWPDIRNRLNNLTSIYTREPYYKEEFKVWESEEAEGLDSSEQTLHIYNSKDAAVTEEVWLALQDEQEMWGTRRAYDLNMMTLDIMARAAVKGIRADWGVLMQMREESKAEADQLHSILTEILGREINVRSWKDVKEVVYGQLGFRERKSKPTSQETLMDIAAQAKDKPNKQTILKTLIKIRQLRNEVSRYIHPCAVDDDGRIRCSWNMAGTKNGRLSSSKDNFKDCSGPGGFKGRGLPLQTIPYKARKIFIPDPGHVFIIPDLEQAEARVVAYLSEDTRVLRWLREDLDIHSKLAELLFNVPYEEIRTEKVETGESDRRYLAKTCRHALNYMMGPRTFKKTVNKEFIDTGVGVTAAEAKSLREKYLTIHSPLKMWWAKVKKELSNNNQTLDSPLGRRRKFIGRWGGRMFRDAIAFVPQSTIGDLTHMGLFEVDRRLPYAEVLVNMHDGSLIQVPEEKAEEAGEVVMDALSIPFTVNGYDLTIPVEVKYGRNWGEPKDSLEDLQ